MRYLRQLELQTLRDFRTSWIDGGPLRQKETGTAALFLSVCVAVELGEAEPGDFHSNTTGFAASNPSVLDG
jgi:hypothetical protein